MIGRVAVIGAMAVETARLRAAMTGPVTERRGPFEVHIGRIEGVDVILAECGIGKVNAAALTQALLDMGAAKVVFTGVAGALAPELRVGDVVIGDSAVQHDVDVTALGYQPGEVPGSGTVFEADGALVAAAFEAARQAALVSGGWRVVRGRVASGDRFVGGGELARQIRERFAAACVEMEGAACAQVCSRWGIPFVIVRSLSDSADHSAQVDFRAFTELAAERAEQIVRGLLRTLART